MVPQKKGVTIVTMTKKRKNKLLPIFILLAVFVVILIAYLALSDANDRREAEETATEDTMITLAELDASTATEIRYKNRDLSGEWITFTKSGGTWQAADPQFPLNTDRVTSMVSAISSIAANRSVEEGSAADYVLDDPAVAIEVTYNGNTTYRYAIGDKNTFNGEYYFQNDDGKFYMISSGLLPYFQYDMDDLIVLDTPVSDIEADYITSVTVTLPTGEERVFTVPEDTALIYDIFCEFDCTRWADYYADDAEMAEYGIDKGSEKAAGIRIDYKKPVTVTGTEKTSDGQTAQTTTRMDASYTLYTGNKNADGDAYYYTPQKSTIVYTIEDEVLEALWQMQPTTVEEALEEAELLTGGSVEEE